MFRKLLSTISIAFFCICLSACSFGGFNPIDKEMINKLNPLSKKQSEESSERSEESSENSTDYPVYRLTKIISLYSEGEETDCTYDQDGRLCGIHGRDRDCSYEYYDNGLLKTMVWDMKGIYILTFPHCPNHIEVHCDDTGAFESVESSLDRELYLEQNLDIPVYEIEVTGRRELCFQGYFEDDVDTTFKYTQKYSDDGSVMIDRELERNGQFAYKADLTLNELGLMETSLYQYQNGEESKSHTHYTYDANGNPKFSFTEFDDADNWDGDVLYYEDIRGTESPSQPAFDESAAKSLVEEFFDAAFKDDSQKVWDSIYRPMQEGYTLMGVNAGDIISLIGDELQPEDGEPRIEIQRCQKLSDVPSPERENNRLADDEDSFSGSSQDESDIHYYEPITYALREMDGYVMTVEIYLAGNRDEYSEHEVYFVSDDAGESGVIIND